METTKTNFLTKTMLLFGMMAIMAFTMNSCTQKISFLTSSVVPAAEGRVVVKNDKNNNYVIQIEVTNLAEVSRLQPPKNSYVVWLETDRGQVRNIGSIVSSNNLKASFQTVSSFKPTRIFITAEENESTQYPGPMVVLTTNRF
jgi:hypothetical protein